MGTLSDARKEPSLTTQPKLLTASITVHWAHPFSREKGRRPTSCRWTPVFPALEGRSRELQVPQVPTLLSLSLCILTRWPEVISPLPSVTFGLVQLMLHLIICQISQLEVITPTFLLLKHMATIYGSQYSLLYS